MLMNGLKNEYGRRHSNGRRTRLEEIATKQDLLNAGEKARWDKNAVDVSPVFFAYVDAVKNKTGYEHLYEWIRNNAIGEIGISHENDSFYVVGAEDVEHTAYFRKFVTSWLTDYGIETYCENSMNNSKKDYWIEFAQI